MVMGIAPHQIDPSRTNGDVLTTVDGAAEWAPPAETGVASLTAAGTVRIDSTDPAHPVVRGAELLMQDGVTSPPVPIETEAGDDWLYQD